jgi:LCP family protein required for cell wall assembly
MPDEQGPGDYDWLFDASAPVKPEARPEPSWTPEPHPAPALRMPAPDLPPPRLPKPRRTARLDRWRRPGTLVALAAPALWVVYLMLVPAMAWSTVATTEAWPSGARPADQDGSTFLVVGSDSRKGLTAKQRKDLKTGADTGGRGRTDTIMLLHVGSGRPVLISIPRDSLLPIPGYGTTKVNAAYAFGGPQLLVETLEGSTGLRIDHYVEIGFGGVVSLVDAVGGVEICPKSDLVDDDAGLNVKEGCQEADGETALAYARARHAHAGGDLQRVQSQREVIGGIGSKVRSPVTFINPVRYYRVVNGGASSVTIDSGSGIPAMVRFGLGLSSTMGENGVNCTVPISDMAVHWDSNRARQLFERIRTGNADDLGGLCTKDGLPDS